MRLTFPERVFESVASLTGQPLQRLEEAINSTDNAIEKWRVLIEHQCIVFIFFRYVKKLC